MSKHTEAKKKHNAMENPEAILNDAEHETEEEKKEALKEDPYYLGNLADKGFKTDGTGVYAPYAPPIYLKLSREDEKTFSFAFYEETSENIFKQFSSIYTKQKSIIEDDPKRNQTIGRYTKELNLKRSKGTVKEWLIRLEQIIIQSEGLELIKDKNFN